MEDKMSFGKRLQLRISEDLEEELQELLQTKDVSLSDFVRTLIKKELDEEKTRQFLKKRSLNHLSIVKENLTSLLEKEEIASIKTDKPFKNIRLSDLHLLKINIEQDKLTYEDAKQEIDNIQKHIDNYHRLTNKKTTQDNVIEKCTNDMKKIQKLINANLANLTRITAIIVNNSASAYVPNENLEQRIIEEKEKIKKIPE